MNYFYNECRRKVFSTLSESVEYTDNIIVITLPDTPVEIENRDMIKFRIAQAIPEVTTNNPARVRVIINGTELRLTDKYGNNVRSDQIRLGVCYYTVVSTQPYVLTVTSRTLFKTSYEFPTIEIATEEVVIEDEK